MRKARHPVRIFYNILRTSSEEDDLSKNGPMRYSWGEVAGKYKERGKWLIQIAAAVDDTLVDSGVR